MRAATTEAQPGGRALVILAVWALATPIAAAVTFRWSPSS